MITVDREGIDVCLITFNEELFIEKCLLAIRSCFKRVFVLDMLSTDRTMEVVRDIFGDNATILSQPRHELFEKGFAHARNKISAASVSPWVLQIDADELLVPFEGQVVFEPPPRGALAARTSRRNLIGEPPADYDPATLASYTTDSTEQHVRLYKKSKDVRWESFLHEELWIGDIDAFSVSGLSNLTLNHLSHFRPHADKHEKETFYGWMLYKVYQDKNLQKNMREFYTGEFIPNNLERFREMSERFSEKYGL
jgi:glycosyltransferase involved in cell wall biosynthesis